jgi:hypothetical protein
MRANFSDGILNVKDRRSGIAREEAAITRGDRRGKKYQKSGRENLIIYGL